MNKIFKKVNNELNSKGLNFHDYTQLNQACKVLTKNDRQKLLNWIDENGLGQFKKALIHLN